MPIRFRCQDCRSRVKVPEGTQGKSVKCPRCGRVQSVPNRNHDSDHVGAQGSDLTVHTCVGSMYKAPKRKEALVGSTADRFDAPDRTGGDVPGGLDTQPEAGNGYHGNDQSNGYRGKDTMSRKQRRRQQAREAEEARLAKETAIAESRKSANDLFATSHSNDGSQVDNDGGLHTELDTAITTKAVARPQAIALDGGVLLTDEDPGQYEPDPVSQALFLSEQPVEDARPEAATASVSQQTDPAVEDEPAPVSRWTLDLTAEAYPFLRLVPWVLRIAALMLIGPAFKGMLVANEQGFGGVVSMLVLFAGLTLVAVTWTVGEIATAVRDIALRRAAG